MPRPSLRRRRCGPAAPLPAFTSPPTLPQQAFTFIDLCDVSCPSLPFPAQHLQPTAHPLAQAAQCRCCCFSIFFALRVDHSSSLFHDHDRNGQGTVTLSETALLHSFAETQKQYGVLCRLVFGDPVDDLQKPYDFVERATVTVCCVFVIRSLPFRKRRE